MGSIFSINMLGEKEILARLNLVEPNVRQQANDAIAKAVQSTYDGSQAACPYDATKGADEPHLRDSAQKETHDLGGSVSYGGNGVDWQWYVELGTCKMSANPFLGPNFLLAEQQLKSDLQGIQP